MATQIAGLQRFELVTERSRTRLPLDGTLTDWQDQGEHRVNEHAILGRSGAIHQSNAQGPGRYLLRCLLTGDDVNDRYKQIESTLADDPFGTMINPRLGRMPYVYRGYRCQNDLESMINGMILELRLDETGLRDVAVASVATAARQAQKTATGLLEKIASIVSRVNNTQPPSLADLTAAIPPFDPPPGMAALIPPAAAIYAASNDYVTLADDPSTDQYTLTAQVVRVGSAADAFAAAAGTRVENYELVAQARLCYGQALSSYKIAAQGQTTLIRKRVPGQMSLARFCLLLYGGGAMTLEAEVLRLNASLIPTPYALPVGVELLVPDPAKVRLDR